MKTRQPSCSASQFGAQLWLIPARRVAALRAVDHPSIVEIKEKRVSVFGGRSSVLTLRFLPRHELALVLENSFAGPDPGDRKYAASVDGRRTYNDAAHDPTLLCCGYRISETMRRRRRALA